jgi:L-cystine transport system substrate-binding protein
VKNIRILIGILVISVLTSSVSCFAKTTTPVTTVRVAVANDFNPYAYLDSKGKYIGYEVDLLKQVDAILPQYSFSYETVSDQFVALAAGKADLITHQWEKNPERAKTYLFGDQLITTWANYIVVKHDRKDINSLKDLKGKTVQVYQGGNDAYLIETYNKTHNNAIKVVYGSTDFTVTLNKINSGAVDAFISPPRITESLNKAYHTNLKSVGKPISNSNTYFIYRRNDSNETKLKTAVDGALKKIKSTGALKKLSLKWLGGDYTNEQKLSVDDK